MKKIALIKGVPHEMDWICSALDEFASLICIVPLRPTTASFGLDLSRITGLKVRQVGQGLGLTSRLVGGWA